MVKATNNISFVVQGPVIASTDKRDGVHSTREVLSSIRYHYPDAEIILSTWKGSDVEALTYNRLVLNDDPGGYMHYGISVNNNRMILSSKAGIAAASSKYVVKTRTDILIISSNLLNLLQSIKPVKSPYAVFNSFLMSTVYYVRNPLKLNLVFHPSDIFLVGEKQDVLSFFDVPLAPRSFYINADETTRIVPEQYFLLHTILKRKNIEYHIPGWGHTNLRFFRDSESYIFNNFCFFSPTDFGIEFPKRLYSVFRPEANYTLKEAQFLSDVYRDSSLFFRLIIGYREMQYMANNYLYPHAKIVYQKTIGRLRQKLYG